MEINLKSSVGRSFAAHLDPVTVGKLIDLAVADAHNSIIRSIVSTIDEAVDHDDLTRDAARALQYQATVIHSHLKGEIVEAPSAIEAWKAFTAEFGLLQTGSGSERSCMEAFMALCEILQSL